MSRELVAFAREYLSEQFSAAFRPPKNAFYTYQTSGGTVRSFVLCRRPPFQVELFTAEEPGVLPEHRHPNVDSIEILLSGEIDFSRDGNSIFPSELLAGVDEHGTALSCGFRIHVAPNQLHGGVVGEHGAAFLSIQHWLNGVEPTSVGLDWAGPEHLRVQHTEDRRA